MLTMKIGRSKDFFFDREAVVKAIDAATRKALSRGGAFIMRGARKSIKNARVEQGRDARGRFTVKRAQTSKPGDPPFSHTGLLRSRIFFAAVPTPGAHSVVIGPERTSNGGEAPAALEFGGPSTVVVRQGKRRRRYRSGQYVPDPPTARKTVQIQARPFMRPALEREAHKLPEQFRNSVVRSG